MSRKCIKRVSRLRRPKGYRALLGIQNAKTIKGEKLGYLTGILYMSPANESGVLNTCTSATKNCKRLCLKKSGRMGFTQSVRARISKTRLLVRDRELFLACLRYDIRRLINRASRLGLIPCVRVNGTSDLAWLALAMAAEFPEVQFYDYTKHIKAEQRVRPNYHLTFSHSGENTAECMRVLSLGVNVSVVFNTKRGQPLPDTWNGYRVVDGDEHDLRFLDPRGVVVGLRAKGIARGKVCAFVVDAAPLIQISAAMSPAQLETRLAAAA